MNIARDAKTGLLVVGASGFVGAAIYDAAVRCSWHVLGTYNRNCVPGKNVLKLDLSADRVQVDFPSHFDAGGSKIAVICACMSSIDVCAKERQLSYKVNVTNTIELIRLLDERSCKIVFVSTDHVFDGEKGNYSESESKHPVNEYGRQKAIVEDFLLENVDDSVIVRLSKVCAEYEHPKNLFTDWLNQIRANKKLLCIKGQRFSPTASADVAKGILSLLRHNVSGIFHVANAPWSRSGLARHFVKSLRVENDVEVLEKDVGDFDFYDERPLESWLDNRKLVELTGMEFRPMEAVIEDFASNVSPHM